MYVALVEVRPLPGCELDPERVAGAAVRCYAVATSDGEARAEIERSLSEDHFAIHNIEWCVAKRRGDAVRRRLRLHEDLSVDSELVVVVGRRQEAEPCNDAVAARRNDLSGVRGQ